MTVKRFFVDALSSALDLKIASHEDVMRHVSPDVLAQHLPRPLWAHLLTACLAAPRVDPQLVITTVGVPNLCEHVPTSIIWDCIAEVAARVLAGGMPIFTRPATAPGASRAVAIPPRTITASGRPTTPASGIPTARPTPPSSPTRTPLAPPPPEAKPNNPTPLPRAIGPNIPSLSAAAEAALADLDQDEDVPPHASRTRTPTGQRFRQSNTGGGRPGSNQRRPQAQATAPAATPEPKNKRGQTEADFDLETDVSNRDDWKNALAVEDEQLVDWSASEDAVTHNDDVSNRKR